MDVKLLVLLITIFALVYVNADLIYHNDEIPYDVTAKCYRGTSYYSNSPKANDTDLDIATSVESLLDYDTTDICFYCICSTDGRSAGCLSRDPWYCEYFRYLRTPGAIEARYGRLFQQDRPAYFRHLSHRIRRTMDEGMFQMVREFKSNSLKGQAQQCVPFVSQYSDCTEENSCSGCKQCSCDEYGQWNCETVTQCLGMDARELDENSMDRAWDAIEEGAKNRVRDQAAKFGTPHVPRPMGKFGEDEDLLAEAEEARYPYTDADAASTGDVNRYIDSQLQAMTRFKRSLPVNNKTNDKVKFYHTVDELNEDTLKHSNDSGTIVAKKAIANFPPILSRRNGGLDNANISNPLHIEYNSPAYDHHISDNKIDTHHSDKLDIHDEKLQNIIGNKTKEEKDKDLSKIIVSELKKGIEIVGDKNAPAISNVTFTRENDTLTAMAFIAGNLLNKLWNMEKDDQGDSIETDVMKHEKIADLVDLFKEPLTMRQEMFLKDALQQLADTMSKGADHKSNIPLCEQVQKIKSDLGISKNCTTRKNTATSEATVPEKVVPTENHTQNILRTEVNNDASIAAVNKLNNVMSLIQKYEEVQKHINDLKSPPSDTQAARNKMTTAASFGTDKLLTKDENQSLNLYGNVLEKITKLLVPKNKHKPIVKAIKSQSILKNDEDLKAKLKRIYNIDLENSTFTSKDKVVLDYLINFRNQKCRLTENVYDSTPIEGGILESLSEFLKIKSFVDLLKLLEPEKQTSTTELSTNILRTGTETTQAPVSETTILETTVVTHPFTTTKDTLAPTKEKLKGHLKAIITDLIELQKASGINSKDGSIKIAEALPCLYNILNSNKISEDRKKIKLNNIKSVFDSLKEELKFNPETRRANLITEPRPKSAAVWERIIKNAEKNGKTRRHFDNEQPKSFEDIHALMNTMDEFSNVYKNIAILKGVPPRKRLSLVKTIDSDVRLYINVLEKIKQYLETTTALTPERGQVINEFIDNALINIKLDNNVLKNLYKTKDNKKVLPKSRNYKKYLTSKKVGAPKMVPGDGSETMKVSRDEIINQLIKNRVQFYLKVKELEGILKEDDINVRLARKILGYLETKNYSLARELFKVFVSQKHQNKTETFSMPNPTKVMKTTPRGGLMALKETLIQFEEEKGPAMSNDMVTLTKALMKQLSNIKNLHA